MKTSRAYIFRRIFGYDIGLMFIWCRPKTLMFSRTKQGSRDDHIFGIMRSKHRSKNLPEIRYIWSLHIGRFCLKYMRNKVEALNEE